MIVTSSPTLHPGVWTQPESSSSEQIQNIQTQFACSFGDEELQAMSSELVNLSHQGRWIVLINPKSQSYKSILVLRPFAFISFSSSQNDEFKAQW